MSSGSIPIRSTWPTSRHIVRSHCGMSCNETHTLTLFGLFPLSPETIPCHQVFKVCRAMDPRMIGVLRLVVWRGRYVRPGLAPCCYTHFGNSCLTCLWWFENRENSKNSKNHWNASLVSNPLSTFIILTPGIHGISYNQS